MNPIKIRRLVSLLGQPALCRRAATLLTVGHLWEKGWVRSVCEQRIVGADGAPLPWVTYPFVDFLLPKLNATWRVFEYGAGASTLFYAGKVGAVVAVEHDGKFAAQLVPELPVNAKVIVRGEATDGYFNEIRMHDQPQIVIVDGRNRNECIRAAIPALDQGGVLVLDDSERTEYAPGIAHLVDCGFRSLPFWGIAPGVVTTKCTSVFYRDRNVLGI